MAPLGGGFEEVDGRNEVFFFFFFLGACLNPNSCLSCGFVCRLDFLGACMDEVKFPINHLLKGGGIVVVAMAVFDSTSLSCASNVLIWIRKQCSANKIEEISCFDF